MVIIIKIEQNGPVGFDVVQYSENGRLPKIVGKEYCVATEYVELLKEECGKTMSKVDSNTWRVDL